MSKAPPRPRLSGFCNPGLPRTEDYDPHQRCRGCDCTAAGCPCNPESDTPMTDTTPGTSTMEALAAASDAAALIATAHAVEPAGPLDLVREMLGRSHFLQREMLDYSAEDWRDAVRLLRDLREVTRELGKIDAQLVHWLYLHGEHGHHMQIDGVSGNVAIGRGRSKVRWAAREAVFDYVRARITANDGEMPDPNDVADWVMEVVPATESTALRKTPLRKMDLDPEDYCTSEPGSLQVSILT